MRLIAINGSPRPQGNTSFMISRISARLSKGGIECESIDVGRSLIRGCQGCDTCFKLKNGKCVFDDDIVNSSIKKMIEADGIILGSPVYFSGISGQMKSFLDRVFYVADANGGLFQHKIGAALVVAFRSGGSTTLDGLNHYLSYSEMTIATSNYWNIAHGTGPGDVSSDDMGIRTIDRLADNIALLLHARDSVHNISTCEKK